MNIRELRLKHNLSQQDVADKTGIPRPRIAKWEEGKGKPKAEDQKILDNFFASLSEDVPPEPLQEGKEGFCRQIIEQSN
jgi:transcriptional regulator with XRE-family HTH domain